MAPSTGDIPHGYRGSPALIGIITMIISQLHIQVGNGGETFTWFIVYDG